MQKVVGYIRVSTTGQAEKGASLDAQRAKIEAWCSLNDGELVAVFEDENARLVGVRRQGKAGMKLLLAEDTVIVPPEP